MTTYGAIVGRFQVPIPTKGHIDLIRRVLDKHENIIIVLGVSRSPANATNPLSFDARSVMLRGLMIDHGWADRYTIVRQLDERFDEIWSQKLDSLLDGVSNGKLTLYTGRDGFNNHYKGKFPVKVLNLGIDNISATSIRAAIVDTPKFDSEFFREGVIYAMNTKHFQTYNTVDMAMLYHDGSSTDILLCRKPHETAWRFPGGFIDEHTNETLAEAAAREMQEETGLVSETGWTIVQDYPIPDEWRLRGNKGVSHRTFLLYGYCLTRTGRAMDDIAEVQWFKLNDVVVNADKILVKEHRQLMINDLFKNLTSPK